MTPKQVAEYLQVPVARVHKEKELPRHKLGHRTVRYNREEVLDWLQRPATRPPHPSTAHAARPGRKTGK